VILYNTILANNTGGDCTADNSYVSHSLIYDNTFNCNASTSALYNNIIGSNPNLGPLQDNGGPTQTMALPFDSPAVGAGSSLIAIDPATAMYLLFDQRGFPRTLPDGTTIDIGAYQYQGTDRIFAGSFESGP
jgi:hypothetical protein